MTYRNKLLLKRFLIVLAVAAAVILLLLLIGYAYLGRYLVFTENGARFSFFDEEPESSSQETSRVFSGDIVLTTGAPISAADISIGVPAIDDADVRGVFLDSETLQDSSALEQLDLSAENTLVLEMRPSGGTLLNSTSVSSLISRAKSAGLYLIAQISCLSDNDYALSHTELALRTANGTLWMSEEGYYWLDPAQDEVLTHLAELIESLAEMGFDEVLLDDFSLPTDGAVLFDEEKAPDDIMNEAYRSLQDSVSEFCRLGLLISDPSVGHQAMDAAERIYVLYSDGSTVAEYALAHANHYLVFLTDSHDTRFDEYGKITVQTVSENTAASDGSENGDGTYEGEEPGETWHGEDPYEEEDAWYEGAEETAQEEWAWE